MDDLASRVTARAARHRGCSTEQALVYACEEVLEEELPTKRIAVADAAGVVSAICTREDLDPPSVVATRGGGRILASADLDANVVCLRGRETTMLTLLHEIAHLSCRADSHGVLFRDDLVRLCRAHLGVEHAAFLHRLYTLAGLGTGPWPATGSRRS